MMSCKYSTLQDFVLLLGRICIALIFVVAGFNKIMTFGGTAAMMASKGVQGSEFVLILAIIFELGGGLLVLFGWYARFGAILLFLFMIPVTYVFHSFWTYEGAAMVNNIHHFFKNLSIMGAMLYIMAAGAGSFSLDGMRMRQKKESSSPPSSE